MATNGVYIVMGEANSVVALLNKARRQYQLSHQPPSMEDTDPLLRNFTDLKEVLNEVAELCDMNPLTYLSPFLDVIKAQNTNGPITEAALSAVAKFLSYGLIDASSIKAANAVESIAYSVVHTKFIGGKSTGSDECVLFKILQVLRSLLLSPPGSLLSNEAVCDMMQSCFRIVFEQNLSLLLRKAAEATLADMTQLIFTRLPTFIEDTRHPYMRKLVKNGGQGEKRQKRRKKKTSTHKETKQEETGQQLTKEVIEATEKTGLLENDKNESEGLTKQPSTDIDNASNLGYDVVLTTDPAVDVVTVRDALLAEVTARPDSTVTSTGQSVVDEEGDEADSESDGDEAKQVSVGLARHGGLQREIASDDDEPLAKSKDEKQMPYGLPCCRELLRFLIALTNPLDRQNTESMVVLGLNLLIVALEAAADHLSRYSVLMPLIKDNLCRSLLQLLDTEKLPVLAATNRCCFLLFESMRANLKLQLEAYLKKLQSIVLSEQRPVASEQKEMALESLVQLWRIPGLVTELYLNYDCDLYCSNVFEELTKLLVQNAFPPVGGHTASLLSLDALLVVIDTIDQNCVLRQVGKKHETKVDSGAKKLDLPILSGFDIGKKIISTPTEGESPVIEIDNSESAILLRSNRHAPASKFPSMSEVIDQKKRKKIIAEGTELFNQSPKKGIEFLREKGLLDLDPPSVVHWLRTNPQLDKKSIADYICSRKNVNVLETFVKSFPFEGTRLDVALRMFLEAFRLPGEAAEISMVMQHFSDEWYRANNEPFNHVDAAFTLSYAIIMLNMDQHNPQVKRNQPTMTVDCFKRNLSGTNGGSDFEPEMLVTIYHAIKSEEIVMPAEQTGIVKENYLWKVLLRRGETVEGDFYHAPSGWNDHDLFAVCWGPAISALSFVFDKSEHEQILQKSLNGYRKCASIAAHYGMKEVFDNLVIHLCKFSTLANLREGGADENLEIQRQRGLNDQANLLSTPEGIALAFGENHKAQLATKALFDLVHNNGDILKEGWRNLLEVLLQLFRARLLPSDLTEVEDFVDEKGWVSIQRVHAKELQPTRSEAGLLSWFGLGGGVNEAERRKPTQEQLASMKLASQVIADCRPSQLVFDSKYLTSSSLAELLSSLSANCATIVEQAEPTGKTAALSGEDEDALVFYLELMVSISLENKDRLALVWLPVRRHLEWLLSARFGRCPVLVERAVVGLLRVANRNLFRDNTVADEVLQSLALLLRLSPKALFVFSRQIAFGLYELVRANAANVHRKEHWQVLFALLEAAGAAVLPDDVAHQHQTSIGDRNAFSDVESTASKKIVDERGYTSDDGGARKVAESGASGYGSRADSAVSLDGSVAASSQNAADWIHLDHKDAAKATEEALRALGPTYRGNTLSRGSLVLRTGLGRHEPAAFLKVCECLAFLLRDAVHVTPDNFESSLQCLRTMVEASLDGGCYAAGPLSGDAQNRLRSSVVDEKLKHKHHHHHHKPGKKDLTTDVGDEVVKDEEQQLSASYQQMSLHLLDLCSQLHSQAPAIFARWAESENVPATVSFVWSDIWRPLLQAMARLGCDCRRLVRAAALTHLQRAFLPANMADLGAAEWESCFGEVLFPLLTKLLEPFSQMDPIGMEDTRVRAIQIVAKTLLNHLGALSQLGSFADLWLRLLDFMEKYLRVDSCGNLNEAVPESLKNMILVVDNTGLFATIPGLYQMTVERLNTVLPQLIRDTIPNPPANPPASIPASQTAASSSQTSLNKFGRVQIAAPAPNSLGSSTDIAASDPTSSSTSLSTTTLPTAQSVENVASSIENLQIQQTPLVPTPSVPINTELTEVVVHSGPTSPIASSPVTAYNIPPQQIEQQPANQEPVAQVASPQTASYGSPEQQAYDAQAQLYYQQQQEAYMQYYQQMASHAAYQQNQQQYQQVDVQQHQQQQQQPAPQNIDYNAAISSIPPQANPSFAGQNVQNSMFQQQHSVVSPQHQAYHYQGHQDPYNGQYAQHQQGAPMFAAPVQSPTVHGQYSRANPLAAPTVSHAPQLPYSVAPQNFVAPSVNSAFSQVQHSHPQATESAHQEDSKESPYFQPIPYPPPQ